MVARHLEPLGHEMIVANPNFAPMYATRSRRTKTDRRDAKTLMEACRASRSGVVKLTLTATAAAFSTMYDPPCDPPSTRLDGEPRDLDRCE